MKRLAGFLIAVGVLFGAVTLMKGRPAERTGAADSLNISPAERGRIQAFWETYRRATDHRIAGRLQEAADEYGRALTLNPEHEDALYYLGNMDFEMGRFGAAEQAWQRLIAVNPTSARAHLQLGTLYFCVGGEERLQPQRATTEFERAAAINREETGPLLSLGEIALVQGELDKAGGYFDAVIGSNYSSVEAHFYRGYIEWASGEPDEAQRSLAAAIEHAQPSAPSADTPGEGDTRTGSAPMVRSPTRCGALRAPASELATLDPEADLDAAEVYGAFTALLREVRSQLP
jgi:tetratricopeptide (TPR) repeat protein